MLYGLDCKQWARVAVKYAMASTCDDLDRLMCEMGKEEEHIFDRIESLYRLVMDETGEEWTQEWRDNLTVEEAAAVAAFDRLFNI